MDLTLWGQLILSKGTL